MKESKFKKGDIVLNRIICEVFPVFGFNGKPTYRYGYRYKHEPEDIDLIWCMESTIIRKLK